MKKLIVAAFAITIAAVSQAATIKWTASNVYEMGSTTVKACSSYIAYFISASDLAYADAVASLTSGSAGFVDTYGQASKVFGSGIASQTITSTAGNSEMMSGYLVILDNTVLENATYAYLSAASSATTGETGQQATIKFSEIGTQTASNWYAVGVPEPTSALMLLVGLAGLALKRKVA